MGRYITPDDFLDLFIKIKQRGASFVFSKFHHSGTRRTLTAFDDTRLRGLGCWDIDYVRERWNLLISGEKKSTGIDFINQSLLINKSDLRLLSLGSGSCETEIKLAQGSIFSHITCLDFSENLVKQAKENIRQLNLKNIEIKCTNIYSHKFKKKHYDVVLFIGSLHHFKNVNDLLKNTIRPCMKDDGCIIIDEYVGPNRLQFPKIQIDAINEALAVIPKKFRKIFKTPFYKNRVTGSGIIRMVLADPSECVDSLSILPALHRWFIPVIEKPYGANVLKYALKDIAHHFQDFNVEKKKILDTIFKIEDELLKKIDSDYIFGVYKKRN